ncbi:MAG: FGGY-family carbohydrate kinase, partial [Oscillospiraceae bacterium]|nr:FGGY-family carbohydrate kinase [Oscillospiraceae bacterium]
ALLGTLNKSQTVVGTLTENAAHRLGLTTKTKVIIGTGDEHSACLGSGLVRPGMVCDITGTAEPVAGTSDKPVFDTHGHLVETHHSADSRLWLVENPGFVSGGSTRWYKDTLLKTAGYDLMNEQAMRSPIGSNGLTFLPCMSGAMTPTWDGSARGTFTGLSLSHTLDDLSRAVFEGISFGLRDNVDRFEQIGMDCSSVRIVGGSTKSPFWCQMKADVLGKPLVATKNPEGAAIGAAMLASVAEGNFADLDEAAEAMVELGATYEPDPGRKAAYDEAYRRYLATYYALVPVFNKFYKGE